MRVPLYRSTSLLIAGVLGLAWALHEPLRAATLWVLRAPFALVSGAVKTTLLLPRLPSLAQEHAALREELSRRALELAELREALRHQGAAATLRQATTQQGVVASVIGRGPLPVQQTILLDRGRRHGVQPDTILVDAGGVVGRIVEAQDASSLAVLITDASSRIVALVERSHESGLLIGQGRNLCQFIYLDADADIAEGDRLVTAGLGSLFPKGLVLGTVLTVSRDRQAGSATALVRPAARLARLEEVLCLSPSSLSAPAS